MRKYLIGYDLNKPGQDYSGLYAHLKSYSQWCRPLDSSWIVQTGDSAVGVRDSVARHLDSSDELLVVDITNDPMAWQGLAPEVGAWLRN